MTKINVNIRLDSDLKNKASKLADKMGTNLSTVINMYLIKFVESWNLEYLNDKGDNKTKIKNSSFIIDDEQEKNSFYSALN